MQSTKPAEKKAEVPLVPQVSALHKEINKIVNDLTKGYEEKKTTKTDIVHHVQDLKFVGNDKKTYSALVIFLPYVYIQNHRPLVAKIVNEVQNKKKLIAFVVAQRTIIHKKSDFKQKIPRNRTLTSVYDSILEDLVSPGVIIGKRSRYHLDGSLLQKIILSDENQSALEPRVGVITQIYKQLTNRKISIEFRPETCYIKSSEVKAKDTRKKQAEKKTSKRPAQKKE